MKGYVGQLFVTILLVVANGSTGRAKPVREATVEGITEYRLDNGLRVLLMPEPSKPTITVSITYLVGSRHEGYGESGMAHLLEHMLFKGTPSHPHVWPEMQRRGAKVNGTTWYDRTNYYETLRATDDNLTFALAVEADRMVHAKIASEDLASEFSVVRNEFERGESDPSGVLEERMCSTAYLWHAYGRATIGSREDIERVPIERLRAFYSRYYQPDNAVLVVAGKFEAARALELIERDFGRLPRPSRKLSSTYTVEPVQDGERVAYLRRTGDVGLVGLLYHGARGADVDAVAQAAIVHILTHQPTGRLYKALVERGPASEVVGYSYALAEPGVFEVFAKVPAGLPMEALRDEMARIVEGLGHGEIANEEIERFRNSELKRIALLLEDPNKLAVELADWIGQGDWRLFFLWRDSVQALKTQDVKQTAARYLLPSNRTVGFFVPTKSPLRAVAPPAVDVNAIVRDYKGNESMDAGVAFDTSFEHIEQGTRRVTLPNGMRLVLLPKKTRGGSVQLELAIHGGDAAGLRGKRELVRLLAPAVLRGTTQHTRQQIVDQLDKLKANVTFAGPGFRPDAPGESLFVVSTFRKELTGVLALLAEAARHPTFPAKEIDALRRSSVAETEEKLQEPESAISHLLWTHASSWPAADARYRPTYAEVVKAQKALTATSLRDFHRNYWGADGAALVVVGDFDAGEVARTVEKEFGDWKAAHPYRRVELGVGAFKAEEQVLETPDKENAAVGIVRPIGIAENSREFATLKIVNILFGQDFSSRLAQRLREHDGLSYGVWSWLESNGLDPHVDLFAYAICAPSNVEKAREAIRDEMLLLVNEGVPARELEAAKLQYEELLKNQLSDDERLARYLMDDLEAGRTMAHQKRLLDAIQTLTPEEVNAALRRYLLPDAFAKATVWDARKGKSKPSE